MENFNFILDSRACSGAYLCARVCVCARQGTHVHNEGRGTPYQPISLTDAKRRRVGLAGAARMCSRVAYRLVQTVIEYARK